jgi:DNA-binding response OmpR family regulator
MHILIVEDDARIAQFVAKGPKVQKLRASPM